ncbi:MULTISPECIES: DUF1648 domain-containing protein [Rubrivivax]|uniref:DUF1648 domain-containing protein n=1 Tax=Rubrivivax benzoatilyticus TaxID=316997 RepID=A0ABX0HVA5_9BURK|nr:MULTISPECIES: DUF1648 domain-containing protein [Rubrivivax]MCD0418909.1 DUF1648 domain-containing protein [Rubrivivax sp. JA1024]MCC9598898.1 DUF1648 domain-containing protein [Rubrivivax sp. JA1055]MCC9648598.1 DUF1648 domain-containing protein [Rubrivivax sp. JA1029]NHK97314.1 DUF1648 domain-containing protein [Rubrivivax benzoatilyticus]NHL22991.1 DUF1648 domain-containing protein [Rubrivivax benzoatilyticus]
MPGLLVLAGSALGVAFVLALGAGLPDVVASHFDASGRPDGHLPRPVFVTLMATLVGGVPLLTWWMQLRGLGAARVALPSPDVMPAQAARAATRRWLQQHAAVFSLVTTAFLAGLYGLVVQANHDPERTLAGSALWSALAAYMVFLGLWTLRLHRRFSRR